MGRDRTPASDIQVDPERFQFKRGVSKDTGIKRGQRLKGPLNVSALGRMVVYEDAEGQQWIVSGHHRLAHIQKSDDNPTLEVDVLRESEGWTPAEARRFGAELNILESGGQVDDYAAFFRESEGMDREQAAKMGFFRNQQAEKGFVIGKQAGDEVYTRFLNENISSDVAAAIAEAAPNDDTVQRAVLKYMDEHPKMGSEQLQSFARYVADESGKQEDGGSAQGSLFGDDADAQLQMRNMAREADVAARTARQIRSEANALDNIRKAGRRLQESEVKRFGIETGDPEAIAQRVEELRDEADRWANFWQHPELAEEVRRRAGTDRNLFTEEGFEDTTPTPAGTPGSFSAVYTGEAPPTGTQVIQAAAPSPMVFEMPELVDLAKGLNAEDVPKIKEKLRAQQGSAAGLFRQRDAGAMGEGNIEPCQTMHCLSSGRGDWPPASAGNAAILLPFCCRFC